MDFYQIFRFTLRSQFGTQSLSSLNGFQKASLARLLKTRLKSVGSKKTWMDTYLELEDINDHSGSLLLLANRYGTKREVETAEAVQKLHLKKGYKTLEDQQLGDRIRKRLWPMALAEFKN